VCEAADSCCPDDSCCQQSLTHFHSSGSSWLCSLDIQADNRLQASTSVVPGRGAQYLGKIKVLNLLRLPRCTSNKRSLLLCNIMLWHAVVSRILDCLIAPLAACATSHRCVYWKGCSRVLYYLSMLLSGFVHASVRDMFIFWSLKHVEIDRDD